MINAFLFGFICGIPFGAVAIIVFVEAQEYYREK